MGLTIEDGKGRGNVAGVESNNRVLTDAEVNQSAHFSSLDDGKAFNTVSEDDDAAAGDLVFYFKNDSTTDVFFVNLVRVCSENAATFKFWTVTGTGSGTTLTPVNLNLSSGVTAEATTLGDGAVTGLTQVSMFAVTRVATNGSDNVPFDDILILGTNDAIAVEYDTGTTGDCEVLFRGFFRPRV